MDSIHLRVMFQGSANDQFVAYTAGKEKLWESPANSGAMAGPMSYEIDGEQVRGCHSPLRGHQSAVRRCGSQLRHGAARGEMLVYETGGAATLPPAKHEPMPLPELQTITVDAKRSPTAPNFSSAPAPCQGLTAVDGGLVPDLLYLTPDKRAMPAGIVAGAKADRGMQSFAGRSTAEEIEAMRQYVIKRSHDLKKDLDASKTAAAPAS